MKTILFFATVLVILSLALLSIATYYNPEDNIIWCERNKPDLNVSADRRGSCFQEPTWSEYCKRAWPADCPKKERGELE